MIHDPHYYVNYLIMFRRWYKSDAEQAIVLQEIDPQQAAYYRGQRDMAAFIISMLEAALQTCE